MSPDSFQTYVQIRDSLENIEREVAALKTGQEVLNTTLKNLTSQRSEQRDDHVACRAEIDRELEALRAKHDLIADDIMRLTSWGRAIAILGSIVIAVLTVLNILLAVGVRI